MQELRRDESQRGMDPVARVQALRDAEGRLARADSSIPVRWHGFGSAVCDGANVLEKVAGDPSTIRNSTTYQAVIDKLAVNGAHPPSSVQFPGHCEQSLVGTKPGRQKPSVGFIIWCAMIS